MPTWAIAADTPTVKLDHVSHRTSDRAKSGPIGMGQGEYNYMEKRNNRGETKAVSIVRRLGSTPAERGSLSDANCPDIFLLSDGRIGYIGADVTTELQHQLPEGASIGSNERLVALPLQAVLDAMPDIPQA